MSHYGIDVAFYCQVAGLTSNRAEEQITGEFERLGRHVRFTKVYLETYRGGRLIDRDRMISLKQYFADRGVKVSGGITFVHDRRPTNPLQGGFGTFCYTDPDNQRTVREIVEFTASLFDEVILDDFYFTSCKCDKCRSAKGDLSWTDYRLKLMRQISEECVIGPAKRVNPRINLIIKYPNWYEHYQTTGYNVENESQLFDAIYTGTETRDPLYNPQHLQAYMGYVLMRYMENIKPGRNMGGWFDRFNCDGNLNYYVNQVNVTLFSKPREIMLFSADSMVDTIFAPIAGYALERTADLLPQLGNPTGVSCYKPYHSCGEDHLFDYIGMLGVPLEPSPRFPETTDMVFLTASAAADHEIVDRIKRHLIRGGNAVITSGLLRALQGRGIDEIAQIRATERRVDVRRFAPFGYRLSATGTWVSTDCVTIPVLDYATNDSWPIINGLGEDSNFPVLLQTEYGDGALFVLAIPDDPGMLYRLPREVLGITRQVLSHGMKVTIDGESRISLFVYDNDTLVVESFLPYDTAVDVVVRQDSAKLVDLRSGRVFEGTSAEGQTRVRVRLNAQSYRAFRIE